jgi:LysR family transcriptional regulator, regulator for genes of the gallate degradation pathway
MRPANPLARHRRLTFNDLIRVEWVLPLTGNALHRRIEARFLMAGVPFPSYTIATNSISAIKMPVRNSDHIAFMASTMAETELANGQLVALPISG